jgi:hypothetical protein
MAWQALTANRLLDGEVVYRTVQNDWSEDFAQARIFGDDSEAKAALEAAAVDIAGGVVVEVYLFDVILEEGRARPASVREVIRTLGPTVRLDLGKQARTR